MKVKKKATKPSTNEKKDIVARLKEVQATIKDAKIKKIIDFLYKKLLEGKFSTNDKGK